MPSNIPQSVQHAILVLLTALLTWAAQVVPTVDGIPVAWQAVISAVIAWIIGYLAPQINYGVVTKQPTNEEAGV